MRRASVLLIGLIVWGWTSAVAATEGPAAIQPAKAEFDCVTASEAAIGARLTDALLYKAHPLRAEQTPIPGGAVGGVVIAQVPEARKGSSLTFRVFIATAVRPWRNFDIHMPEKGPTKIVPPARGVNPGPYTVEFNVPDTDESHAFIPRLNREVYVVACDGPNIQGWGADSLPFAPERAAKAVALGFVVALYVLVAFVVYRRRRAKACDEDDTHEIYRISEVKPWRFRECLDPVALTADFLDRGSLSKFQILFFLLLITFGLTYLAIWKGDTVDLSPSLVYLLGLPALGTLGFQFAALSRDRLTGDNWSWLVKHKVLPLNQQGDAGTPRWADLIMSDTELDLTKLQALTFSGIVAISMWVAGPEVFATFKIPESWLQVLGLSQFVFVGGKLAKRSNFQDLDALLTELRRREGALRRAASTGVDVDESGKPLGVPPRPARESTPGGIDRARAVAPTAVQRFIETAQQVQVLLESLAHRSVDAKRLLDPRLDIVKEPPRGLRLGRSQTEQAA